MVPANFPLNQSIEYSLKWQPVFFFVSLCWLRHPQSPHLQSRRLGHRKGRRQGAKLQLRHAKMLDQGWSHPQMFRGRWTVDHGGNSGNGDGGEWTITFNIPIFT